MNLPNKISLTRIFLIPLVVFFFLADFIPWGKFVAGLIFVIACLTDFVDGKIARKYNLVTDLGKFLDTIADKVLIMAGLVLLVATPVKDGLTVFTNLQWLGIICAIIILAREFAVSALRQIAAAKGIVLAADKSGKVKAALQDVVLSLYFFFAFYASTFYNGTIQAHKTASAIISIVLICAFAVTTILTITSGIEYFVKNKQVFASENKAVKIEEPVQEIVKVEEKPALQDQMQEKPANKTVAKKSNTKKKTATKAKKAKPTAPKPAKPFYNKAGQLQENDARGRAFDELIPQALDLFSQSGWASTTMLQKHMGVGYPRASKIVDQMQELGYISAGEGLKTRNLLITKEEFENLHNN